MKSYRPFTPNYFLLLLLFCILAASAKAQSSKPPDDKTLQSLVNEVRLLRVTLQRINLSTYRSQIIVERIRAQNDRVARLTRMLEDTRDESANIQVHINQLTERAKSLESQVQQESDAKQRSQLEVEQKEFKYVLDQQRQRYERLRERELRLNSELQAEQGKLSELEGRLDALEREIENEMERQRSINQEKSSKQ
jgi:predicted  nucleic acid-binding Zn-ribbon protein